MAADRFIDVSSGCASGSSGSDGGRRVLIACCMVEDEVKAALELTGAQLETVWVERGFHEKPDVLRAELQRRIDEAEMGGATQILLAYGLCGGGIEGLKTREAQLVVPRFDDCVNFMLETGCRTCRGKAKAGVFYLTEGWVRDEKLGPSRMYKRYLEQFGERKANRLIQIMYGAYRAVSLIDNGCYDLEKVFPVAYEFADTIGVDVVDSVAGSNVVLEKLVAGLWDDDIIVAQAGEPILQADFEFDSKHRGSADLGACCATQAVGESLPLCSDGTDEGLAKPTKLCSAAASSFENTVESPSHALAR